MKHATANVRAVRILTSITLLFVLSVTSSAAEDSEPKSRSESDLAAKTQNPVANFISLPFQNNTGYNAGPRERTRNVMNIQPVIPVGISEEWLMITRTIFPIISEPSSVPGQNRINGTGDTTFTAFLSPKKPAFGKLIWGAGPTFNIPTASDDRLGADLWGMGMSVVGLVMQGPIVAGALIGNTWNLEGKDFSRFLLQYFLNYNLPNGWYITSSPILTADWEADDNAWSIPVGGGFGKVTKFKNLPPINLSAQAFYHAEKTKFGEDWSRRLQVQFLFPR